jgi:cytoskeleton protein RodZ
MDDKNKLADDVQTEIKRGSGSILTAARKLQNKTVEEIADELNLSVTQIRTIESDQSEGLPEPTYVRGYIRSYARLLGLDADEVLEHYLNPNWQKGARLDDMPRDIGSADESRSGGFFTPLKLVVLLLIAGLIAYLLLSGKLNDLMSSGNQSASTSSSSTSNSAPTQAVNNSVDNAASNVGGEVTEAIPEATGENEGEAGPDNSPASSNENSLSLNYSDTSWVDIRDANGERLAYKSYAKGEVLTVSSETQMSIFIGNAKAVSADLNGQAYDISQYREGVFARFTIGESQ